MAERIRMFAHAAATGKNDGTSWEDAFTSLNTALTALDARGGDCSLYLRGDFFEATSTIDGAANFSIIADENPDHTPARVFGFNRLQAADITDEGGGIFSLDNPESGTPMTCVWAYQQDDADGLITGVTTNDDESVAAQIGTPVNRPEALPWFGHMNYAGSGTDPDEGEWKINSGTLYVYPPGSPASTTEVANDLMIGRLGTGISINGCSNFTIKGLHAIGWGDTNTQRASFRITGCRNFTLKDLRSWDAGYRSFNIEGSTGDTDPTNFKLINCIAAGDWTRDANSNFHFVVYNNEGTPNANAKIIDSHAIFYPWLDYNGRPIAGSTDGETYHTSKFQPSFLFSHTGNPSGAPTMGGIELIRCGQWSQCQNLNAKHNATATLGMFWEGEGFARLNLADTNIGDISDPDTYTIKATQCLVVGVWDHYNILLDGCRLIIPAPKGGLTSYATSVTPESTQDYDWVQLAGDQHSMMRGCEALAYHKTSAIGAMIRGLATTSHIYHLGCTIIYIVNNPGFDNDCIYRPSASHTIHAPGTVFIMHGPGTSNGAPGGSNRHFMRFNGATPSGDYPATSYGNMNFDGCWWFGFSNGDQFYRGGATGGTSYAHFADTDGGSPIESADHIFATDPELNDLENGDLRPAPDGALATSKIDTALEALAGLIAINGAPYRRYYGAYQGKAPTKGGLPAMPPVMPFDPFDQRHPFDQWTGDGAGIN